MSLTSYQAAPPRNLAPSANGAPDRSRTYNPQIRSLMLYPVELQAQTAENGEYDTKSTIAAQENILKKFCMGLSRFP